MWNIYENSYIYLKVQLKNLYIYSVAKFIWTLIIVWQEFLYAIAEKFLFSIQQPFPCCILDFFTSVISPLPKGLFHRTEHMAQGQGCEKFVLFLPNRFFNEFLHDPCCLSVEEEPFGHNFFVFEDAQRWCSAHFHVKYPSQLPFHPLWFSSLQVKISRSVQVVIHY